MADRYHFVQDNVKVKLSVVCTDSAGIAIDLSTATVSLRWRLKDGTIINKDMSVEDAAAGVAIYLFQAGELVPPTVEYEITVTKADGAIITSLDTQILGIRARLA